MPQNVYTLIVEDDFYARHWMEMLLRRDWRTRVAGQAGSLKELGDSLAKLEQTGQKIHVAVIDTEIPGSAGWLEETLQQIAGYNARQAEKKHAARKYTPPAILFTGMACQANLPLLAGTPGFAGFVLKNEICYSLAWAVILAARGQLVWTPGVKQARPAAGLKEKDSIVLDGRRTIPWLGLSPTQAQAARLAVMYSMERFELANELNITVEYAYGLVREVFINCGLEDHLRDDREIEAYFGDHPAVKKQVLDAVRERRRLEIEKIQKNRTSRAKLKNMETLAFHLLTMPLFPEE
jgi:hypothetical protein